MESYLKVLNCLGKEANLRIYRMLTLQRELCVCELEEALRLPQYAVSRALKNLVDCGLVEKRKQGPWRLYSLKRQADRFLDGLETLCRQNLPDFYSDMRRLKMKPDLRMKKLKKTL